MKRLQLLRHAKSSWKEGDLPDRERPLAPRGRRATVLLSAHLREEQVAPEVVLCSVARRARETLEGIAPALGDGAMILIEDELYGASAASLLERLRALPDEVDRAMLVGHNPALQQLVVALARPGPFRVRVEAKYPTGALATLTFDGRWSELEAESASLAGYVTPKDLR